MTMRKQIARGTFTRCFEKGEDRVVLLSVDPIKKHIADGNFPDSPYFPKVDFKEVKEGYHVYEMDRLVTLSWEDKKEKAEKEAKLNERSRILLGKLIDTAHLDYGEIHKFLTEDYPKEMNEEERLALWDAAHSFDHDNISVSLEFCYGNLAINHETGNLIFMDVFFPNDQKDLEELGLTL